MKQKRILAFDYARGMAILLMIVQHVMLFNVHPSVQNSTNATWLLYGGTIPAAPIFLLLMGVFFVFSRKSDFQTRLKRGLTLILLGYLLVFVRFLLPALLSAWYHGSEIPTWVWIYTTHPDILHLAGMGYLILAFVDRYFPRWGWAILGLFFGLGGPLFWEAFASWPVLEYLWPWAAYPLGGYALGKALASGSFQSKMNQAALIGLILAGVGGAMYFPSETYFQDFSGHSGALFFLVVGGSLVWLWLWTQLERFKTLKSLEWWSRNVTVVYFVQWIVIGWMAVWEGAHLSLEMAIVWMGVVMGLSYGLTQGWYQGKKLFEESLTQKG